LLIDYNTIICDSYGNLQLSSSTLLSVVCHRKDAHLFDIQKARCLAVSARGAVLVSARIAKNEQETMNADTSQGFPVIVLEDNGFPSLYYPSGHRMDLCSSNKLLIVTPWQYVYRRANTPIAVAECKTMDCIVQALCHTKDS
jgi:hypothetical protein